MTTPTIEKISKLIPEIKASLKPVRKHDFGTQAFGEEGEFNSKSVSSGIEAVLIDLKALCDAPAKFLKITTSGERKSLVNITESLLESCKTLNLSEATTSLELYKPILRHLRVRDSDLRQVEFSKHIDDLQRRSTKISSQIQSLNELKEATATELELTISAISKANSAIEESKEKVESLDETARSIKEILTTIESTSDKSSEKLSEIEQDKLDSENFKLSIEEFVKKIAQRELQLEKQAAITDDYKEHLKIYKIEHDKVIEQSKSLIEDARTALGYSTAQGLSAAFTEKHIEAKSDRSTKGWIISAAIFITIAITMGAWITFHDNGSTNFIIGRLSLIPLLVGGAWFSASQYVKQKNLSEEYAYKSVLVKSMVGFSEHIADSDKKGEDHSHFVRNLLAEIHMNPIRKPSINTEIRRNTETNNISPMIEKLSKLVEPATNTGKQ